MQKIFNSTYFSLLSLLLLVACVPKKDFDALETKYYKLRAQNITLQDAQSKLLELLKLQEKLTQEKDSLSKEYDDLKSNQSQLKQGYDLLISEYDQLNKSNELSAEEKRQLEHQLKEKELSLSKSQIELYEKQKIIEDKAKQIDHLQNLLKLQKEEVAQVKQKIKTALLSYENRGITVEEKNGRIYVSMENKLLFESGSWTLNGDGKDAIKKIAEVLTYSDIDILVEGHTDNQDYAGKGEIEDNWDLSVKRATTVVKLLQEEGVTPNKLLAGGRGQYLPLQDNETSQGRSANRRVEIILTPNNKNIEDLLNSL